MRSQILTAKRPIKSKEVLYPPKRWDRLENGSLTMEELTRSNKELEQFAFLAAHDLQEPLKVACCYTALFNKKYRGKLDDNADVMISSMMDSNDRMQKLVQSLLTFAQAGRGEMQFKELDSRFVVKRAIDNLKITIEEASARISCEGGAVIQGDEIQLTQLFQNLINNAIKFRKKEEVPSIQISVQEREGQYLFSIRDNGIGIEPEYTQKIFDVFKRLHTQSEYAGSGIGLSICKRIVESHGGKIWVESEIGEGATVYFSIPQYKGVEWGH